MKINSDFSRRAQMCQTMLCVLAAVALVLREPPGWGGDRQVGVRRRVCSHQAAQIYRRRRARLTLWGISRGASRGSHYTKEAGKAEREESQAKTGARQGDGAHRVGAGSQQAAGPQWREQGRSFIQQTLIRPRLCAGCWGRFCWTHSSRSQGCFRH